MSIEITIIPFIFILTNELNYAIIISSKGLLRKASDRIGRAKANATGVTQGTAREHPPKICRTPGQDFPFLGRILFLIFRERMPHAAGKILFLRKSGEPPKKSYSLGKPPQAFGKILFSRKCRRKKS